MSIHSEVRLEDLRKLTNKVNAAVGDPDFVWPLDMGRGVEAYRLHREPRVAVLRACVAEGEVFPRHIHNEDEVLICYAGRLAWKLHKNPPSSPASVPLNEDNAHGVLGPGDVLVVPANQPHSVLALGGDCWIIAVTVPASEAF